MPRGENLSEIPALFKRNTFHLLLYGFITGVQHSLPSVTKEEAAQMFLKRFKITPDAYDTQTIVTTYNRINKEIIEVEKKEPK